MSEKPILGVLLGNSAGVGPELVAMLGTAIATCISDIPFDGPCAMTTTRTTAAPSSLETCACSSTA